MGNCTTMDYYDIHTNIKSNYFEIEKATFLDFSLYNSSNGRFDELI